MRREPLPLYLQKVESTCDRIFSCDAPATCIVQIGYKKWHPSCEEHAVVLDGEIDIEFPLSERVRWHLDWWGQCRTCQFWGGDRTKYSAGTCGLGQSVHDWHFGCYRWDTFDMASAEIVMGPDPDEAYKRLVRQENQNGLKARVKTVETLRTFLVVDVPTPKIEGVD